VCVCVAVTSPTEFDTSPNQKRPIREDTRSGHLIRNRMALSGLKRFHFISGFDCCVSSSEKRKISNRLFVLVWRRRAFFTILRMYERAESTLSEKSREFRIYITCTVALHITWESNLACTYVVAPPSLYKEIKMKSNFFFQKRETLRILKFKRFLPMYFSFSHVCECDASYT
jgi:hypothetical protein